MFHSQVNNTYQASIVEVCQTTAQIAARLQLVEQNRNAFSNMRCVVRSNCTHKIYYTPSQQSTELKVKLKHQTCTASLNELNQVKLSLILAIVYEMNIYW